MPRRGRQRSRRQRSSSQRANGHYIEVFTFSVQAGNSANVTVATLADRPPRSNFRPRWMECEYSSFVPGTDALPASYTPVGFQFTLASGTNAAQESNTDSTSRLRLASTTPRTQRISNPVSADWYTWDQDSTTLVAIISAVCIGRPAGSSSTSFVRGVCRMRIDVQEEVSATTCPALRYVEAHSNNTNDDSHNGCGVVNSGDFPSTAGPSGSVCNKVDSFIDEADSAPISDTPPALSKCSSQSSDDFIPL